MTNVSVNVVVNDLKKTVHKYWQTWKHMRSMAKETGLNFQDNYDHLKYCSRAREIIYDELERAKDLKRHFDDLWIITMHIAEGIQNYDSHRRNEDFDNIQCKSTITIRVKFLLSGLLNEVALDLFRNMEKGNSLFDKLNAMGFELMFAHWNIYQRGNQVMKAIVRFIRMEKKDSIQHDQQDLIDKTREISEFINGKSECLLNIHCDLDKGKSLRI
jgi:hypothetical protein